MPTVVTETDYLDVSAEPPRKKWTRAECEAFEATGLWEGLHLELVEGELINKMGKKRPHSNTLMEVLLWLRRVFGEEYVSQETPIDVAAADNPTSEPEPDLIVLDKPFREFRTANPQPNEIRLAVEISDSRLGYDLKTKAKLFARAGIIDYWVFDVQARRLIVHRDPREGRYQSVTAYSEHESVSPLAAPDRAIAVRDAFPS